MGSTPYLFNYGNTVAALYFVDFYSLILNNNHYRLHYFLLHSQYTVFREIWFLTLDGGLSMSVAIIINKGF